MQFIVAHPDTQHSAHAASGLKRAGMLRFLVTSVSLRRPAWLGPIVKRFSPGTYTRLAQHRAHADLDRDDVRIFPSHLLAMRLGDRIWGASQARFGRYVGHLGRRERCGVMAFNTNAVETFRILKREGLPCVLDQSIAHRRWSNRIGQAECDAFPEWGDRWASAEWRVSRDDEEIELADLVLCGSQFCATTMIEEGTPPSKVAVVEYGADTSRFVPAEAPRDASEVRLLFVGMLALRKGLHYLLEATQRLAKLGVKVTAVGASRVRPEMLARYASVLRGTGFRLHEEMPALYRAHDIYVFPSIVEGSSLSIYEATASGLPVITTPNAGSIVRDGVEGFIVPPRDVDRLTAAIEQLVRDRDLRIAMGRAARARAEQFGDWRHYGERLSAELRRFDGTADGSLEASRRPA
jgi:glycosyltransferase involved in cell wall biosynthesis